MKSIEKEAFTITKNYDSICETAVFEKLFKVLLAFAYSLIGNSNLRLSKNRQELAKDFAMETIKAYLSSPDKFEPKRNKDLVQYLKYNILRRLVFNFKESKGQKNEEIIEDNDHLGIKLVSRYYNENSVSSSIDLEILLKSIVHELKTDELLSAIFDLRYIQDYDRADICTKLQISYGELNNCFRRLDTVLKKVVKKYEAEY